MRKTLILFLTVITLIFLYSCSFGGKMGIIDNDQRIAQETIEEILNAIQSKDKNTLKSLFAKNSLTEMQSFEESAEKLFNYFEGTLKSYDDGAGPFVETTKDENQILQLMESSFAVKTDKCEYRFAIQYITKDTACADNVGVHSLYLIKTNEDINLEYVYWGDGQFTPGIHVAIPNTSY